MLECGGLVSGGDDAGADDGCRSGCTFVCLLENKPKQHNIHSPPNMGIALIDKICVACHSYSKWFLKNLYDLKLT